MPDMRGWEDLLGYFHDIGPAIRKAGGVEPVDWAHVHYWGLSSGADLGHTVENLLVKMSQAYVNQCYSNSDTPPFTPGGIAGQLKGLPRG